MATTSRLLTPVFAVVLATAALNVLGQQNFCAPPIVMPKGPPSPPPPAVCEPKPCKCTASPCYVDSGIYFNDAVDLMIPTNGYPLLAGRHYDSSVTADGPIGVGWISSLTAHLYYAIYLYAPNVYQYEADVVMPDGARYRFTDNFDGSFSPPAGRRDTLIRNANGTFTMTIQRSRSVFSFGTDGTLTAMTDDFGNALTFAYDANGRVQTVADASGSSRSLTVIWNPQGRIADVSDSSSPARHIVYSYNSDGTLSGVRDPVTPSTDQSTHYAYTAGRFGPVLSDILDRWNRTVSHLLWYTDGKLMGYTDGDYNEASPSSSTGERYIYGYSPFGGSSKASSLGLINHTYAPGGLITDHAQYDAATGNPISTTDGAGFTSLYDYDSRANVSVIMKYPQNETPPCCTTTVKWYYTYDPNYPDQVSTITPKDTAGNIKTNWASWAFDYNLPSETAPGALKRVKRFNTTRSTAQTMAEYTYDSKGHVLTATDERGLVSTYVYDAAGNKTSATVGTQTTTYAYDAVGRVTSATDALGHPTTVAYDGLDRILSVTLPPPSAGSALNFTTTYSYDNLDTGIVYVNVTDPSGRVTKTGYDALGHVVRTIDALGNATQFTYQYNLLKNITDANGNVTTYAYDYNRNLTGTTFPDNTTDTVAQAWDGTLLSVTDRRGIRRTFTRDGVGRIVSVYYDSAGTTLAGTVYTYDGQRLAKVAYGSLTAPTLTTFTYDPFWNVQTETQDGRFTITNQYDSQFPALLSQYRLAPVPPQTGASTQVAYAYDADRRITSIYLGEIPITFTIDYTALGQYNKITYPNGQNRRFTYDDQGRLTLISNRFFEDEIASFAYAYDHDWNTNADTMMGQRTSVFATGPGNPFHGTIKYGYDANYQLTSASADGSATQTWTYDAIGNRLTAPSLVYTYDKNGNNPLNGNRLHSASGLLFTYDAAGNMTGRGGMTTYNWDYLNRLIGDTGTTFTYDFADRRTSSTVNNVTTRYISLGLHTIAERVATSPTTTTSRDYIFAPGIDEPLAMQDASGMTYYSVDGLGSVVTTTNASGTTLASGSYDAWGLGGTSGLFGFTGREPSGSSLWFFRARYYDPTLGRFISEDPTRLIAESTYGYALNSPVLNTDPLGLAAKPAAAHVCCDGNGGFKVCWDQTPTQGSNIEKCTLEHEQDHIKWFGCHPPYDQLCKNQPPGFKNYTFSSQADVNSLECSGYEVQYKCMKKILPQLSGSQKSDWWGAMNKLMDIAKKGYKCNTSPWWQ